MKSAVYTLSDEVFAFFVNRAAEVLREKEIPYAVVGGIGVQARILDCYCRAGGKDVSTLVTDDNFRSQDYLRATDSVDFALRFHQYDKAKDCPHEKLKDFREEAHTKTGEKIREVCDEVVNGSEDGNGGYFSFSGEQIFRYGIERIGSHKQIFSVSVDNVRQDPIWMMVSRRPEDLDNIRTCFYNHIIKNGEELVIPYSTGSDLRLRVAKPEHLLAVKIASDRPKDAMDIKNLVLALREAGEFDQRPDFPRFIYQLKKCLLPNYKPQLIRFCEDVGVDIDFKDEKRLLEVTSHD